MTTTKCAYLFIFIIALLSVPVAAPAQEVWMFAGPHIDKPAPGWEGLRTDSGDMWKPDAPWEKVSHSVSVIQLAPTNISRALEPDLKQALEDIKRRNLALALEASLLVRDDTCRSNTEAYGNPGATEFLLQKIKRNGGDLKYLIMDEPFYFGHHYSGPTACHESAEALAKKIATMTVVARRIFPQLQVGAVEVVDNSRQWVDELLAWADTYKRVTGEPLAFFHTDVAWSEPAMRNLVPLEKGMKERHIPFGVIYNADAEAKSDTLWTNSARRHWAEVETVLGVHPDNAVFETWVRYPTRMMPETQSGTWTNLVLQYVQPAPSMNLKRSSGELTGRLVDSQGHPVASAQVIGEAVDFSGRMPPVERHSVGKVPANTASALAIIRANIDGACACAGDGTVTVGVIRYSEPGTDRHEDIRPFVKGSPNTSLVRQIKLTKGATDAPNLEEFPVTAGADYTLDVPMAASMNVELAGFVSILFRDAANKQLYSDVQWFHPSVYTLGTPTTDGDGRFQITIPPEVAQSGAEIRVYYPGNNSVRPQMEVAR